MHAEHTTPSLINSSVFLFPPQGGREGMRQQDVAPQPGHGVRADLAEAFWEGQQDPSEPHAAHQHGGQLVAGSHGTGDARGSALSLSVVKLYLVIYKLFFFVAAPLQVQVLLYFLQLETIPTPDSKRQSILFSTEV